MKMVRPNNFLGGTSAIVPHVIAVWSVRNTRAPYQSC